MESGFLFTSESVFEGHPDKVADQISDAVLDAHLVADPKSRVACETLLAKDLVVVAGEITARNKVDYESVARDTLRSIGYNEKTCGIDASSCKVLTSISKQSGDIADGVDREDGDTGAGDQGMMFGYATDETPELMPLAISLAHRLSWKQAELRKNGTLPWLKPDGKTQVSVRYEGNRPVGVETIVFSTHHDARIGNPEIYDAVQSQIIEQVIPGELRGSRTRYLINPAGRFEIGGPFADTGLTGRKIIVDTYGGSCPHGGGAFSGKDPTKVDRSAAYMARYVAKNIVAAGLASRCTVQLSYAIGRAEPTSLMCDLHGTGQVDPRRLEEVVRDVFKLKPRGIIDSLDLRRAIYQKTAAFGHFGRELPEFTWELTDKVAELRQAFGLSGQPAHRPGKTPAGAGIAA